MRRRTALAAVLLLALLPASVSAAADPEEELEEVEERLDETRDDLEDIDRQRDLTLEDLHRIDAEIAALDARLAELGAELAVAEQDLARAEQRLADTTSQLVATQERLDRTRARLVHEREVLAHRTRASFMHGGSPSLIGMTLDAGDIAEFGRAVAYVEHVIAADRDRITRIEGLAREIDADRAELDALHSRQAEERALAVGERDRVAGLVASEQEVRGAAQAERDQRTALLAELDAHRETHLQMVAELEAESQALEEELRRRAEEERRRREASRAAPAPPPSSGQLQRPSDGRLTSNFGWRTHPIFGTRRFHAGADFGAPYGSPIYAAEAGVVVSAGSRGGYGLAVVIDHGGGLSTLYAHQSRLAVSAGQAVARGQVIGAVGSTGYSTGPHLHFEVRVDGVPQDPVGYL